MEQAVHVVVESPGIEATDRPVNLRPGRGGNVPPVHTRLGQPGGPKRGSGRPKGFVPLRSAAMQLLATPASGDNLEQALGQLEKQGKRVTRSHQAAARLLGILEQRAELGPAVAAFRALHEVTKEPEETAAGTQILVQVNVME